MDVLITGGAGFLGAHLSDELLRAGHRVTVFDDLSKPDAVRAARRLNARHDRAGRLSFVFRDVRDAAEIGRAVAGKDAVFHAAAVGTDGDAPLAHEHDFDVRVRGTMSVLDALRTRAPRAHFILPSTSGVYGATPLVAHRSAVVASEKTRLSPVTPCAAAAVAAESYVQAFARSYSLPVTILRFATVYGSDLALDEGLVGRLLEASSPDGCLVDPPAPASPVDLIHAQDACRAIGGVWNLGAVCAGRIFNVGGGARMAPAFAEIASFLAGRAGPLRIRGARSAEAPPPPHVLDIRRLERVSGWRPAIGWADGLSHAIAAARISRTREEFLDSPGLPELFQTTQGPALVAWPRAEGLA